MSSQELTQNVFDLFRVSQCGQGSTAFFKKKYKEYYGFDPKKFNDARLYPIKDPLKETTENLYQLFTIAYQTNNKLEYINQNSQDFNKLKLTLENDFNPSTPINSKNLLLSSINYPNVIQPYSIQVNDENNKTYDYVFSDHMNLVYSDVLKTEVLNESRVEYQGNNTSNSIYNRCMNPYFSDVDDRANKHEKDKIFEQLFNYVGKVKSNLDDLTDKSDSNSCYGFYSFFYDVMKEVLVCRNDEFRDDSHKDSKDKYREIIDKEYFNNPEFDGFMEFPGSMDKFSDMVTIFNQRMNPNIIKDKFYKCYMKLVPYMLSPTYEFYCGNVGAIIFFMALSIMSIKRIYQYVELNNEYSDDARECLNALVDIHKSWVLENFVDGDNDTKIETSTLYKILGPGFFSTILHDDIPKIIDAMLGCSVNPTYQSSRVARDSVKYKPFTTYFDSGAAVSGLVELLGRLENVEWFDSSLFELNINNENVEPLKTFAESLLEATLIYKNSMCLGQLYELNLTDILDDKCVYHHYDHVTAMRRFDVTCTVDKNIQTSKLEKFDSDKGSPTHVFSTLSFLTSLANSIQICVDNFNSTKEIFTNKQLKRPKAMMILWKEYIRQFLSHNGVYINHSASHLNEVTGTNSAFQWLAAMDYCLSIKTWIIDSYYFWRNYRLMVDKCHKNFNATFDLLSKYNDLSSVILKNEPELIIPTYARGLQVYPICGLWAYGLMIGNLLKFTNYEGMISAWSRILMKDLYIFGDQDELSEDDYKHFKYSLNPIIYPFVMKDQLVQKTLNLFPAPIYEKIISSTYLKWFNYDILPVINYDEILKNYIIENIPSFTTDETTGDDFIVPGVYNQVFGYEVLWDLLVKQRSDFECLKMLSSIIYCVKFIKNPSMIHNNKNKFNNFKLVDNNCDLNVVGPQLMNKVIKANEYNYSKRINLLEVMCNEDRIKSSVDDVYCQCNALPIYLFYNNGLMMLFENFLTNENSVVIRELNSSLVNTCLEVENLMERNLSFIVTAIKDYGEEKYNDLDPEERVEFVLSVMRDIKIFDNISTEDESEIFKLLTTGDLYVNLLHSIIMFSNSELYCKGIYIASAMNWDIKQYKKFLAESMHGYNKFVTVRNEIVNINTNLGKPDSDKIDKVSIVDDISESKQEHIVEGEKMILEVESMAPENPPRIFRPMWENSVLTKLSSIAATTHDGIKMRKSFIQLSKILASSDCRFIFEYLAGSH